MLLHAVQLSMQGVGELTELFPCIYVPKAQKPLS